MSTKILDSLDLYHEVVVIIKHDKKEVYRGILLSKSEVASSSASFQLKEDVTKCMENVSRRVNSLYKENE